MVSKRIDERDTIFARMAYREGTLQYEDYYERNPEKKEEDDRLRAMPGMCSPGTGTYNEVAAPFVEAGFSLLGNMRRLAEGEVAPDRIEMTPEKSAKKIKAFIEYLGGKGGMALMKKEFYYSHRGRHPENYGEEVDDSHAYAIAYTVEMEREMINRAPNFEEVIAVTKGYMDAAVIGLWIAAYIRGLGYDARAHVDGNYTVCAPLVAREAGLGDLGRHGLLVTEAEGSRVRLGVVTTNLPMEPDERVHTGIQEFCEDCGICAKNCPGKAIPKGRKVDRWQTDQEKCYEIWKRVGTDCGICLSSCPLSQEVYTHYRGKLKNQDARKELLEESKSLYGRRNYIKKRLDIMK